jgi:hypothetical protein
MISSKQIENDRHNAWLKAQPEQSKPSALDGVFTTLFNVGLPKDYLCYWTTRYETNMIYEVVNNVHDHWCKAHPEAGITDICKVIGSVLRAKTDQFHRDHFSPRIDRLREKYGK